MEREVRSAPDGQRLTDRRLERLRFRIRRSKFESVSHEECSRRRRRTRSNFALRPFCEVLSCAASRSSTLARSLLTFCRSLVAPANRVDNLNCVILLSISCSREHRRLLREGRAAAVAFGRPGPRKALGGRNVYRRPVPIAKVLLRVRGVCPTRRAAADSREEPPSPLTTCSLMHDHEPRRPTWMDVGCVALSTDGR